MASSGAARELIKVECTLCNTPHYFPLSQAGASVRCEMCTSPMTVPLEARKAAKPLPKPDPYGMHDADAWQPEQKAAANFPVPTPYGLQPYEDESERWPTLADMAPMPPQGKSQPDEFDDEPLAVSDSPGATQAAPPPAPFEQRIVAAIPLSPPPRAPKVSGDDPFFDDDGRRAADVIPVQCPGCGKRLTLDADQFGQRIACPKCGRQIVVQPYAGPAAAASSPSAPAAPKPTAPKPAAGKPAEQPKPTPAQSKPTAAVQRTTTAPNRPAFNTTATTQTAPGRPATSQPAANLAAAQPASPSPFPPVSALPTPPATEPPARSRFTSFAGKLHDQWRERRRLRHAQQEQERRRAEFESAMKAPDVALAGQDGRPASAVPSRLAGRPAVDVSLPPPPKFTFVSGIFTFLVGMEAFGRVGLFAVGLLISGELTVFAISLLNLGPMGAVAMGFFLLPVIWLTFFTWSYGVSCFYSVLASTANGAAEVDEWVEPDWREWVYPMLSLFFLIAVALAMGFGVSQVLLTGGLPPKVVMIAIASLVLPVLVLSAYYEDQLFMPLSATIGASLGWLWWGWLIMYLETGLLIAGWVALAYGTLVYTNSLALAVLVSAFPFAVLFFLLARIWGRLLWRIIFDADSWLERSRLREEIASGDRPANRWNERQKAMTDAS